MVNLLDQISTGLVFGLEECFFNYRQGTVLDCRGSWVGGVGKMERGIEAASRVGAGFGAKRAGVSSNNKHRNM